MELFREATDKEQPVGFCIPLPMGYIYSSPFFCEAT